MRTLVWYRRDLRLADHPALQHAVETSEVVIPVFLWNPEGEEPWQPGGASRWWLHHSLHSLERSLQSHQSQLIVRTGPTLAALLQLIQEAQAGQVVWGRCYEPAVIQRDKQIKAALKENGVVAQSFNCSLLHEPFEIMTKEGRPYQVYTPYWKRLQSVQAARMPLQVPKRIQVPREWPETVAIDNLGLLPRIAWDAGFFPVWQPGETGAHDRMKQFCESRAGDYADRRNLPGIDGTSQLSPHLHFGEISPNQIWQQIELQRRAATAPKLLEQTEVFQKELVWREFAYYVLYHFPHTPEAPLREEFRRFPWHDDKRSLAAWQKGLTGYPFVDAGMRQLWTSGWMHNRVRMVCASFLVKHLLIPWQQGAAWFWDTLVDADLASNTLGWQWTAGCGADAAPFFRIFNPVQQGERFDAQGDYVRRWVPELSKVPSEYLHAPWKAPSDKLKRAGVVLGQNYPSPIVEHAAARKRAMQAFDQMRGK